MKLSISLRRISTRGVIAGLDPAIHEDVQRTHTARLLFARHRVDARVKPGHDTAFVASVYSAQKILSRWFVYCGLNCARIGFQRTTSLAT